MHCRPKVLPTVVHPTKNCVQHQFQNYVVPHIHPTHNTLVNHHIYNHTHYFPQTNSVENVVSNQQFTCPGPGPMPFGQ
ncbi:spore coat protein CotH [Bacillus sp. HMF5848]|uniref:CotD family spore coat protein n=1 Tax=Bacillus sp. HMF5848 TaxID=2495421 RepID=UPI000F7A4793|nr:CotD family spore coat protein [Bacillus sp. HMF5848]RSK27340.1 spore coat protein CotH [Bacillus sp. HMF5848]